MGYPGSLIHEFRFYGRDFRRYERGWQWCCGCERGGASPTGSGSAPQPSETTGTAVRGGVGSGSYWAVGAAVVAALV